MTPKAEALDLEDQLANLLLQVRASDTRVLWHQIGIVAHDTANALRSKDGEGTVQRLTLMVPIAYLTAHKRYSYCAGQDGAAQHADSSLGSRPP